MKLSVAIALTAAFFGAPALADGHRTAAPEGAKVYIVSPTDGATVSNPVTVVFGLEGMGIAPAGAELENTGHHHLLINTDMDQIDLDTSLPATDQIVHFGGGQTQVTKELPPGTHKLQLLLGDSGHVPHDPPIASDVISVTVE